MPSQSCPKTCELCWNGCSKSSEAQLRDRAYWNSKSQGWSTFSPRKPQRWDWNDGCCGIEPKCRPREMSLHVPSLMVPPPISATVHEQLGKKKIPFGQRAPQSEISWNGVCCSYSCWNTNTKVWAVVLTRHWLCPVQLTLQVIVDTQYWTTINNLSTSFVWRKTKLLIIAFLVYLLL